MRRPARPQRSTSSAASTTVAEPNSAKARLPRPAKRPATATEYPNTAFTWSGAPKTTSRAISATIDPTPAMAPMPGARWSITR